MANNQSVSRGRSSGIGYWSILGIGVSSLVLVAACGGDDVLPAQAASGAGTGAAPAAGTQSAGGTPASTAGTTASAGRTGSSGTTAAAGRAGAGASGTAAAGTAGTATSAGASGTGAGASGTGASSAGTLAAAGTDAAGTGAPGSGMPAAGGDVASGESSCLDGITNYDAAGKFMFETKSQGAVRMLAPMLPAGCKVPIVHLANGTGASCANYQPILERFASHGFLTACYDNPNTGAGTQGVMAFEAVMQAYPDRFVKKLGSTGHSQGGQAAFMVLVLSEQKWGLTDYIYAGLAMEPASGFGTQPSGGSWQSWYGKIKSPMFAFSGTADMLVPQAWVAQGFNALADDIEAYHWSAVGATHIPTPDEHTMQIGVAWWRWKLLGDKAACEWFKKLPDGPQWNVVKEQNAKPCS